MAGEVIRKKLLAGQQVPAEGGPGADRAWRLAFARAARDMMQLPVDVVGMTLARVSLAELLDLPPERALNLMLEGPEEGLGLLILSPELLSALIEVMTMGKCGTQSPDPRKPTRTDAAMLSPLADLALENLEEALAEEADLVWTSGFRYASFIEEARSLGLLLEDVAYRTLTARLSLAYGARTGDMILVLPAEGRGRKPRHKTQTVPGVVAVPAFSAALAARVDESACLLEAVLARVSMSLSEVMALSVDDAMPLPTANLEKISLEGLDGRRVSEGKLGQHRGMRAIRVTEDSALAGDLAGFSGASAVSAPHHLSQNAADWPQSSAQPEPVTAFDFAGFPATGTD